VTINQTCIWPSPAGLDKSDPLTSTSSQIFSDVQVPGLVHPNMIVEDSQTSVLRQTSVDSCEPVDLFCRRDVTRRVVAVDKRFVPITSRDCSDNI